MAQSQMLAGLKFARQLLAPTPRRLSHPRVWGWLILALMYAGVIAALIFDSISGVPYGLPDDTRPHLAWMQRFSDPELFANDLIADYFQAVSPAGYAGLYRLLAHFGIPPLSAFQLLVPILVVLTAIALFWACLEISALPAAGFAAVAMLSQSVEFTTAIATGTSKAFTFVTLFGFLAAWLRRSFVLSGVFLVCQGLFAPQVVLLSGGIMMLEVSARQSGQWRIRSDRTHRYLVGFGLLVAAFVVLSYAISSSQFGPTIRADQALNLPDFLPGGRNKFFDPDVTSFLLYGRSGLRPDIALTPITNVLAFSLPFLGYFPQQFPLTRTLYPRAKIIAQLLTSSLMCFWLAHIFLFRLHLPSRYAGRFLLASVVIAGSIAVVIWLDALLRWLIAIHTRPTHARKTARSWLLTVGLGTTIIALAMIVVFYPLTMSGYPSTSMSRGRSPELYEYFATQPKSIVIASLSAETSNIPSFSGRTVITSPEVSLPYHVGYYTQIRQRTQDLIAAQYSLDPTLVADIIAKYGITHWVIDDTAFDIRQLSRNRWIQQYQPEANAAVSTLASRQVPILQQLASQCTTFQTDRFQVLDAACLSAVHN